MATTDKRPSARRLARALNVTLLDGEAVSKLTKSEQLKKVAQVSTEEFDGAVKRVDEGRRSGEWRQNLQDVRSSLISGMGVQSTNRSLLANAFFAEQTVSAQPQSEQAQVALRLFYLTSAFAAISLDYLLADQAFRSQDDRRQSIIGSIRVGESESAAALPTIRAAIGLSRKYAENGTAVAKQIEYGFYRDAERIAADIIGDYVARISTSDALFNVAREIERGSTAVELPSYDHMSTEARSLLGVFLDFNGVSREKIALAWPRGTKIISAAEELTAGAPTDAGPLFTEAEPKPKSTSLVPERPREP